MGAETQTQQVGPDPRIQRTLAMITSDYVDPYGANGEPARVVEAAERSYRASRRALFAAKVSGLAPAKLDVSTDW
jgi:hypothetical protein